MAPMPVGVLLCTETGTVLWSQWFAPLPPSRRSSAHSHGAGHDEGHALLTETAAPAGANERRLGELAVAALALAGGPSRATLDHHFPHPAQAVLAAPAGPVPYVAAVAKTQRCLTIVTCPVAAKDLRGWAAGAAHGAASVVGLVAELHCATALDLAARWDALEKDGDRFDVHAVMGRNPLAAAPGPAAQPVGTAGLRGPLGLVLGPLCRHAVGSLFFSSMVVDVEAQRARLFRNDTPAPAADDDEADAEPAPLPCCDVPLYLGAMEASEGREHTWLRSAGAAYDRRVPDAVVSCVAGEVWAELLCAAEAAADGASGRLGSGDTTGLRSPTTAGPAVPDPDADRTFLPCLWARDGHGSIVVASALLLPFAPQDSTAVPGLVLTGLMAPVGEPGGAAPDRFVEPMAHLQWDDRVPAASSDPSGPVPRHERRCASAVPLRGPEQERLTVVCNAVLLKTALLRAAIDAAADVAGRHLGAALREVEPALPHGAPGPADADEAMSPPRGEHAFDFSGVGPDVGGLEMSPREEQAPAAAHAMP